MSFHELAGHILSGAVALSLILLGAALLLTLIRIVRGPTLADRVLGLDMLTAIAIGFIAVFGLATGFTLYLDIAISLGLVGFLATVAFARFILAASRDREKAGLLFDDPRRDRRAGAAGQGQGQGQGPARPGAGRP